MDAGPELLSIRPRWQIEIATIEIVIALYLPEIRHRAVRHQLLRRAHAPSDPGTIWQQPPAECRPLESGIGSALGYFAPTAVGTGVAVPPPFPFPLLRDAALSTIERAAV